MTHTRDRVFVIAEAGVNHNGSLILAKKLVDVAFRARADAVKFQSFTAQTLVTTHAPKAAYQKRTTGAGESQVEMLRRLELSRDSHRAIAAYCRKRRIEFLSTPFDVESLRFLVGELRMSRIKIASGEITNAPLLLAAARTGRPVILSTGMSTLDEVSDALGVLAFGYSESGHPCRREFRRALKSAAGRRTLAAKVSLLHCVSEYPAPIDEINLRAMDTLRDTFGIPVGLSDHTMGIAASIAAAARGAKIIEKHFTVNRELPGPDQQASLEPGELEDMVRAIREVEMALGSGAKVPTRSERSARLLSRRSLVAASKIRKGDKFNTTNVAIKRPGSGISPLHYWEWLGRTADRDYANDELLTR